MVDLYDAQALGRSGRVAVATADLLRAAVVFLHATLDDLVRSTLDWKLPEAAPEHLATLPLVGCSNSSGHDPWCDLSDLALHRGKTIDVVLTESVSAYLEHSNFSNPGHIEGALSKLGLAPVLAPFKNSLGPMMSRRHWIVHRADRNDMPGQGQYSARSISASTVKKWQDSVSDFGTALLGQL